jgi:hypothetical protein
MQGDRLASPERRWLHIGIDDANVLWVAHGIGMLTPPPPLGRK